MVQLELQTLLLMWMGVTSGGEYDVLLYYVFSCRKSMAEAAPTKTAAEDASKRNWADEDDEGDEGDDVEIGGSSVAQVGSANAAATGSSEQPATGE